MDRKEPIALARFQKYIASRRQVGLSVLALISAGGATAFFATAGPVDPLRDTLFSLAIALDLLTIFLVWQAVMLGLPWWLQAEEERGPFTLHLPEVGATLRVRVLRGPTSPVRVVWYGAGWRYGLLLLATALYGVALGTFVLWGEHPVTYVGWLGSVLLLLLAYAPIRRPSLHVAWREVFLVLLLLGVGLALRLYHLTELPLKVHGDMASVGLQAREILNGRSSGWFSLGWATIPMWGYAPEALSLRLWGDSLYGLRMSAVMGGMFSLLGVYFLGKEGWIQRVGLWALAALVVDVVHIHFSRIPSYMDPVPWVVWSMYFLLRGYHRRSPIHWALAGMTAMGAANMYFSGRVILPVIGLFLIYLALFHRGLLKENREGVVALFLGALFALGPMLLVIAEHSSLYFSRARFVLVTDPGVYHHLLNKYQAGSLREILLEQVQRTFLTYQYYGDTSTQFGYTHPMLNPWIVPFFLLGIGVATGKLRHPGNFLLSTWWLLGLVGGSVLTTDAPFWPRLVVLTPANALAIGLGMVWLGEVLKRVWKRQGAVLWSSLLVLLLLGVGWQNWTTYRQSVSTHAGLNDFAARVMLSFPDRLTCYVRGSHSLKEREFQFLLHGRPALEIRPGHWKETAAVCADRHGVVIGPPEERSLIELIARAYPGGKLNEIWLASGSPKVVVYEMP